MTDEQRNDLLVLRQTQGNPWHSPPHRAGERTRFHLTAACYGHKSLIGSNTERIVKFEDELIEKLKIHASDIYAWCILPNHYHVLLKSSHILELLKALGKFHGRLSFIWNGEDAERGRKVWCGASETSIKSDGHFWATMNYVHNNPVHHKYVDRWQSWPFSSANNYLKSVGKEKAMEIWDKYPLYDYGKEWDPPEF